MTSSLDAARTQACIRDFSLQQNNFAWIHRVYNAGDNLYNNLQKPRHTKSGPEGSRIPFFRIVRQPLCYNVHRPTRRNKIASPSSNQGHLAAAATRNNVGGDGGRAACCAKIERHNYYVAIW